MGTWVIGGPQGLALDGKVTTLDVWLVHGKVHVIGTQGPARVEVRKVGRKGLVVSQSDGVLAVRHDAPRGWLWWWGGRRASYYADVIVAVPPEVAASLTVIAGDVVASGLRSSCTVDVTGGSVRLMGLGGAVRAKTVSGSIEAVGISGDLAVHAVSGEISLAGSSADRVRASTISGAVTCDLDNPYARDLVIDTVSGSITVRVPEDADLRVSLGAASGRVTSAFAGVAATNSMGMHGASGQLGRGAGSLRAHAVSGSVSLLASPPAGEFPDDESEATHTARRGPDTA
jgi:hypothetical protein